MEFKEFREEIKIALEVRLQDGFMIGLNSITKNNGVVLHGITISNLNINVAPTIYLEEFYREYCKGRDFTSIVEDILSIYENNTYKEDLDQWLSFLQSIGYSNEDCMILNSLDYGVPQNRERAFIVSHLGAPLNITQKVEAAKHPREYRIRDFIIDDYSNPLHRREADEAQLNKTPSRDVMWRINGKEIKDNMVIQTITCNMDRTHTAALFEYEGHKGHTYRRLTIREAFLLMGFSNDDYDKAAVLNFSYRKMNKLIGNSIVVNVLESVFSAMFGRRYRPQKRKNNNH